MASSLVASVINVPADFATIQEAIDAGNSGDTILVAPGTYTGAGNRDIDFNGKNLVLKSELGPEVTIIDCQASAVDQHLGIHLHSGEDSTSVIDGFTVTHAFYDTTFYASFAAIMSVNAAPTVKNCIIRDNSCIGVSYYTGPNTAYIFSTEFINNGGGLTIAMPGLSVQYTPAHIDSCRFIGNKADGAYLDWTVPLWLHNSTFARNDREGALVWQMLGLDAVDIGGCTFYGNQNGLAYYLDWPKAGTVHQNQVAVDTPSIYQCLFSYNRETGFSAEGISSGSLTCNDSYGNGTAEWRFPSGLQWDTLNNFTLNPLFCDTSRYELGVSSSSPCLAENNVCAENLGNVISGCGPCCVGLRGNVNFDPSDNTDIADIVYFVEYAFSEGPPPPCFEEADLTADGGLDIADLIYLIEWAMVGGPAPLSCP